MIRDLLTFGATLILVLSVVASLHAAYLYANDLLIPADLLLLGYGLNFLLAIGLYTGLTYLASNQSPYLGFAFLFGSALKFIVYFLIFDPIFKRDGSLSAQEFFYFFIPYFSCLTVETIALVRLLNRSEK